MTIKGQSDQKMIKIHKSICIQSKNPYVSKELILFNVDTLQQVITLTTIIIAIMH